MILQASSWHGILSITRDLAPLFDAINIAAAMHRLAKIAYSKQVGCPAVALLLFQVDSLSAIRFVMTVRLQPGSVTSIMTRQKAACSQGDADSTRACAPRLTWRRYALTPATKCS